MFRLFSHSIATTMTNNDSSPFSRLTRFFYQHICPRCAPESRRLDQSTDQQITADLRYVFDPLQVEVRHHQWRQSFLSRTEKMPRSLTRWSESFPSPCFYQSWLVERNVRSHFIFFIFFIGFFSFNTSPKNKFKVRQIDLERNQWSKFHCLIRIPSSISSVR